MNIARFYTVALLLFGATLTLTLAVVCLIYGIYLDDSPKLREEWPTLLSATLMFAVLTIVAAGAFQGLRKQAGWMWPAQGVLVLVVVSIGFILKRFLLG